MSSWSRAMLQVFVPRRAADTRSLWSCCGRGGVLTPYFLIIWVVGGGDGDRRSYGCFICLILCGGRISSSTRLPHHTAGLLYVEIKHENSKTI